MRTRAYRRHQRARIRARHLRDFALYTSSASPRGDIAIRHPLDCGRRCLLCHWSKFLEPRRARERREWLKDHVRGDS